MNGGGDRTELSIPPVDDSDDLADFAPRRTSAPAVDDVRKAVDGASVFPSREASTDAQINLKGPKHVLDRFKAMCKEDRRAYYDMLRILMDAYESK